MGEWGGGGGQAFTLSLLHSPLPFFSLLPSFSWAKNEKCTKLHGNASGKVKGDGTFFQTCFSD